MTPDHYDQTRTSRTVWAILVLAVLFALSFWYIEQVKKNKQCEVVYRSYAVPR